jgi:UDP-N-acetylmuramoylalanine--D-glutamate ligase
MLIKDFINKQVYLWGTGLEGQEIIKLWEQHYPDRKLGIIANDTIPADADIIIKSPGVSAYKPNIIAAKAQGVVFTSMMDIFLSELRAQPKVPTVISVTGTKGKSLTTDMLAHMLKALGCKTGLGGNIGVVPLSLLGQDLDYIVLELSSFQITGLHNHVDYAIITNLSRAHLDWHLTLENYHRDKASIIKPHTKAILNHTDPRQHQYQGTFYGTAAGFHVQDSQIFEGSSLIELPPLNVMGDHNLLNLCGDLTVLKMLGLDYRRAVMALASYHPLDHRLQKVHESQGRIFIDDSIATVADSVIAGIKACKGDVALIMGGQDNNSADYEELGKFIDATDSVKIVLALPDTGKFLHSSKRVLVNSMQEAVTQAIAHLPVGYVLLSPAAPSFNMYKNYKERGHDFARLARELLP